MKYRVYSSYIDTDVLIGEERLDAVTSMHYIFRLASISNANVRTLVDALNHCRLYNFTYHILYVFQSGERFCFKSERARTHRYEQEKMLYGTERDVSRLLAG